MSQTVKCYSEYETLHKVVMCPPSYMKIREIINHTQEKFAEENIDTERALEQHNKLIKTLRDNAVEVICLPVDKQYPEQVFTRDIGFVLDSKLFIAQMDRKIRQGEEEVLKAWLKQHDITFEEIVQGSIEGGDVLIDNDTVWVGDSYRTSKKAIEELQKKLPKFKVIRLPFDGKYLHLDCVFNVLSPTEALVYPPAFAKKDLEKIAFRYQLIEVSEKEQFTLGTNVLSIGNKKVLSLPLNQEVNKKLIKHNYTVIQVDISEIIKSGGSFRCITLPLNRSNL